MKMAIVTSQGLALNELDCIHAIAINPAGVALYPTLDHQESIIAYNKTRTRVEDQIPIYLEIRHDYFKYMIVVDKLEVEQTTEGKTNE